MGYYTWYLCHNELTEEQKKSLEGITRYDLNSMISEGSEVKWYDHENDIMKLSKNYPDVVFFWSGTGEESDDQWRFYAKNGKTCKIKARIEFDEFTEDMLS